MFLSVMVIFALYAIFFILFEDYDRSHLQPFNEASDWHLLIFSFVVMGGLAWLLHRYSHRMDERISREQTEKENKMRRELTHNIAPPTFHQRCRNSFWSVPIFKPNASQPC